jgi:hypothetical protein
MHLSLLMKLMVFIKGSPYVCALGATVTVTLTTIMTVSHAKIQCTRAEPPYACALSPNSLVTLFIFGFSAALLL